MNGVQVATKKVLDAAYLAEWEYRLQTAAHQDCQCFVYLANNRDRLLPKFVAASFEQNREADIIIMQFCSGLHQRHLDGKSIFNKGE